MPFPYDFKNGEIYPEIIKKFIVHCAKNDISDINIQGGDYIFVERFGRLVQASKMTIPHNSLVELIGELWGQDIVPAVTSGHDQDRALSISGEEYGLERGESIRIRSNFTQGTINKLVSVSITSRIIPSKIPTFATHPLEDEFRLELYARDGMNVFAGPTGSGKTTIQTAYYVHLGEEFPDRKLITYEHPVEFVLGGRHWKGLQPCQSEIGRDIESFADGIRNAMRRAPKVIGIGEARDKDTFSAAVAAAKSGHLLNFTLHIDKTGEVFPRMIQAFPTEEQASIAYDILSSLRVVMVQNLFKSTDGRRILVREGLVFTQEIKRELEKLHHSQWAQYVNCLLTDKKATIIDKLWLLYKEGRVDKSEFISKATYQEFTLRSEKENINV